MRKLIALMAAVSIAGLVPVSMVQADAKYKMAGCGLGSILFEDDGFVQIFAATTNGSSGNQTFGISSGTSNCEETGGGEASAKAFIQTNREALSKDVARGTGETISTLSTLSGCTDDASVGTTLQKNFSSIFPSASVSDTTVSDSMIQVLKTHPELSCHLLG